MPGLWISVARLFFCGPMRLWHTGWLVLLTAGARAAPSPVSFVGEIAPILRQKCLTCHGAEKAKGGYRMDTFERLRTPGSSKSTPIVANAPDQSYLLQLLTTADEEDRMPQKDEPLPKEQIALFERWIREGATFDAPDTKQALTSLGVLAQPAPPESYSFNVPVTALAFHPGGAKLAASGYHEVTVWDIGSGTLLGRITNVAERTLCLAYNDEGTLLATASGTPGRSGETKLFDPATGQLIRTLVTTPDLMLTVAFHSPSKRLACAGADNIIRIFDTSSFDIRHSSFVISPAPSPLLTIEQHADWVTCVAFSPDGSNIVSSSRDKTVRVFDTESGELHATCVGHSDAILSAAFIENDKRIVSGGRDKGLRLWETMDAKEAANVVLPGEIHRLVISTNGIFVAADRAVYQYTAGGKRLQSTRKFIGHEDAVYSVALHEASGRLASGSYDGEVRLWNIQDGTLVRTFTAAP
jgi:WD40 repeat protein